MKKDYIGTWKIKEMDMWDEDYIDLTGTGQIKIGKDGIGSVRFGAVQATLDCKTAHIGEEERIEFTFEGSDEGDQCSGRGWMKISRSEMTGRIFFHLGDDSGFKAIKSK